MGSYLDELMHTLDRSQTLDQLVEVLFVNDGSTDDSLERLEGLQKKFAKIRIISSPTNRGRFEARYLGAKSAQGSHLLFLDARVSLTPEFGPALRHLFASHDSLMGTVRIDTNKSVYNLYWQRTHETLFRRSYRDAREGYQLTADNYESYLKGTTVFLCKKKDFVETCARFEGRPLHSDDTFLMREMVISTPIWVHESLAIEWEPRQQYWSFLRRLWERGPQFAEYHVLHRQGLYFFLFVGWTLVLLATVVLLLLRPSLGLSLVIIGLGVLAISTAIFARNPIEFLRMIPVHVGTILAYGLGALYGVAVNLNWVRKPAPTEAKR